MKSVLSSIAFLYSLRTKALLMSFFLVPLICLAAVRYVPSEYSSIQAAIDAASDGDEIIVSPGTYGNIYFRGKNIILRSTDPTSPTVVASTAIDGGRNEHVVTFSGTELSTCVLSGFTITRGDAVFGGGIYGNGTRATIENNYICENSTGGDLGCANGGGLHNCDGMIKNNIISRNSAWGYHYEEEWNSGWHFLKEHYFGNGGGLYGCDGTIQNNVIYKNSSGNGGGLYWCNGIIQNNIIYSNTAKEFIIETTYSPIFTYWNYIFLGYGGGLASCSGIIRNCIVWKNEAYGGDAYGGCTTPSYSCVQGISSNPQFVDANNGNFHLLPGSPCIDAGCYIQGLTQDFEGDPRPINGSLEARGDGSDFDIGADEYRGPLASEAYDFDLTNEGWNAVTVPGFTPPYFYYIPGQIKFAAQDNTNTYGYWTSEEDAVPVIADCLYRASWTVTTDITDPLAVPSMRLRVNSQNLQQADMLVVSSTGDGSYAPIPEGWTTYEMYFVPPESALGKPEDQDDLILSFDIMNFDPGDAANGSLLLDSVVIDIIALNALGASTPLKTWNFDADAEGWQYGSAPLFFTEPVHDNIGGALWLIAQDNTNTFGFWSGPPDEVQIEADKLYRVRFSVSSDVTERELVPGLRLRVHSEDFQAGIVKVINSVMGAEMSPSPEGHAYHLYFYPPQSLVGTDADSLILAFDILNFDPTDAATGALMLNSVLIESLDVP
jgi:hypothetical protein